MTYNQCRFERTTENGGTISYVAFIPTKFAIIGERVKLKFDDNWIDGWVVHSISEPVEENCLPDSHKSIKQHRKNTGDSLPKGNNNEH